MPLPLLVYLGPTSALAVRPSPGGGEPQLERTELEPAVEGRWPALAEWLKRLAAGSAPSLVAIALEPPLAQVRVLQLPPLARADLRLLLRHHASRYFLGAPAAIVADAEPERGWFLRGPRGAVAGWMDQVVLESIDRAVREAGFSLTVMTPAAVSLAARFGCGHLLLNGEEPAVPADTQRDVAAALGLLDLGDDALVLLPEDALRRRAARPQRRTAAFLLLAVGLLVGAMATDLYQIRQARVQLELERTAQRAAVSTALGARGAADLLAARLAAVESIRSTSGGPARMLAELTRTLPDSAYLLSVSVAEGRLRLTGLARSATAIIPSLERSRLLREVALASSLRLTEQGGLERFDLTATVDTAAW